MANIKSQIKRDATSKAANEANSAFKSKARTAIKKVEALAAAGKKEEAQAAYREACSYLDEASRKDIIAVNNANRKKAHLARVVAAIK